MFDNNTEMQAGVFVSQRDVFFWSFKTENINNNTTNVWSINQRATC
jgi:hypothetical protein